MEPPANSPNLSPVPGSRRGKSGRPRTGDAGLFRKAGNGHNLGTVAQETQARSGAQASAAVHITTAPVSPRLLDLHTSALYLGLSEWTVRDLEQAGILARVRIPLPNQGELRKLLFDKADFDLLIAEWKEGVDRA